MRTPQWDMMNALCSYLQVSLRGDSDLLAEFDLGEDGHSIVQSVYPCRVFDESSNGLALYLTDLPVVGIYPVDEQSKSVHGLDGMHMTFGLQYAIKGQVGDQRTWGTLADIKVGWPAYAKMQYILEFVWWKLRDYLQNPASILSSYKIKYMACDTVRFLPPLSNGVYALEATGEMEYALPPWHAYPDAVEFEQHDGTMTETSIEGGYYETDATELVRPWSEE